MQIAPQIFFRAARTSGTQIKFNLGLQIPRTAAVSGTMMQNIMLCCFSAECFGWLWCFSVWWALASWSAICGTAMWALQRELASRRIITRHGACRSLPSLSATPIVYSGPRQRLLCPNCESWIYVKITAFSNPIYGHF